MTLFDLVLVFILLFVQTINLLCLRKIRVKLKIKFCMKLLLIDILFVTKNLLL